MPVAVAAVAPRRGRGHLGGMGLAVGRGTLDTPGGGGVRLPHAGGFTDSREPTGITAPWPVLTSTPTKPSAAAICQRRPTRADSVPAMGTVIV